MIRKNIMIAVILFCCGTVSFALNWHGSSFFSCGLDYTENFFSFLYNSQLSPELSAGIELTSAVGSDGGRFSFTQEAEFHIKGGNRYWKNGLIYYTDKTYSLVIQADYRFLVNFRFARLFAFYFGSGAHFVLRSDRYSIGKIYNYTNLRITPFLPTIDSGIRLNCMNSLKLRFHHEIGAMVGTEFYFRQYEIFDVDNIAAYYFYNMLSASVQVKLYKDVWLLAGYKNKIIAGLSCQNLTGRIFWSNTGFLGVNIELF